LDTKRKKAKNPSERRPSSRIAPTEKKMIQVRKNTGNTKQEKIDKTRGKWAQKKCNASSQQRQKGGPANLLKKTGRINGKPKQEKPQIWASTGEKKKKSESTEAAWP